MRSLILVVVLLVSLASHSFGLDIGDGDSITISSCCGKGFKLPFEVDGTILASVQREKGYGLFPVYLAIKQIEGKRYDNLTMPIYGYDAELGKTLRKYEDIGNVSVKIICYESFIRIGRPGTLRQYVLSPQGRGDEIEQCLIVVKVVEPSENSDENNTDKASISTNTAGKTQQ